MFRREFQATSAFSFSAESYSIQQSPLGLGLFGSLPSAEEQNQPLLTCTAPLGHNQKFYHRTLNTIRFIFQGSNVKTQVILSNNSIPVYIF